MAGRLSGGMRTKTIGKTMMHTMMRIINSLNPRLEVCAATPEPSRWLWSFSSSAAAVRAVNAAAAGTALAGAPVVASIRPEAWGAAVAVAVAAAAPGNEGLSSDLPHGLASGMPMPRAMWSDVVTARMRGPNKATAAGAGACSIGMDCVTQWAEH